MKANFVCPACKATITGPASLQGHASPCPKCRATVDPWPAPVGQPAPAVAPAPARAPAPASAPASVRVVPQPPPVEQAVWFYTANGARRGPVTTTQLKSQVETGVVRANDLIWREGLPGWVEAGTVPELFPPGALVKPPPVPAPAPAPPPVQPPPQRVAAPPPPEDDSDDTRGRRRGRDDEDEDGPRSRRGERDDRPIQVHVHQSVERGREERDDRDDRRDDRRPRRRDGFRCPYCGSTARPIVRQQVSTAGWVVFALLFLCTIIFCFIGLFIKEDVRTCPDCGARL